MAGDVHKGSDKLLFMDEIKNLQVHNAIELLSVMEDGESVIKTRGGGGMGTTESTAIMAIATADPVPANFMLLAAGNMDILHDPNSVLNIVTAFRDRFNYGDIIYFDTHMDATPENEVKVVQVITDEVYRFGLLPMNKDAVRRVIEHMRSRAENNKRLRVMWRYVIKVILKSYELALEKELDMVTGELVEEAIQVFCAPVEQQAYEERLLNRKMFKLMRNSGSETGMVNGLAVLGNPAEGRSAGISSPVAVVSLEKKPDTALNMKETFFVTGVSKDAQSWIQDSILHVRTAIFKMYGIDPALDRYTHISFAQAGGKDGFVDGPSAGTTMTLAIMSHLGDPRLPLPHAGDCPKDERGRTMHQKHRVSVPLRLDVAVTGTIELIPVQGNPKDIRVGSIGGVPDKVSGAAAAGIKYVIVPNENFEHTLTSEKYPCEIFGGTTILDYFDLIRADQDTIETLLKFKKPEKGEEEDLRLWGKQRVEAKVLKVAVRGE